MLGDYYGISRRESMLADGDAATRAAWAERGRNDLHFFCTAILGLDLLTAPDRFHGQLCRFASQRGTGKGRLCLAPRGHFKSTINTVASTIQDLVINPDSTILIMTGATELHKEFLAAIKEHIESNSILRGLYPYLRPGTSKWDATKIVVNRRPGIVEPSVTALSWKQSPEGKHYTRVKVDDIATLENMETRLQAKKVLKKLQDLVSNIITNDFLMSGTRYADFDPYDWVIRELVGNDIWELITFIAETDEPNPDWPGHGMPIFPERFTTEVLKTKALTLRDRYWAQYMNDPMPEELQKIKRDMFLYWDSVDDLPDLTFYLGGDHASGEEHGGISESVLTVGGIDAEGRIYLREVVGGIKSTADFVDLTFKLYDKYNIMDGLIERYSSAGNMLKEQFSNAMRDKARYIPIHFETGGGTQKEKRIETVLSAPYEQRAILHPRSEENGELENQLQYLAKARSLDRADAWSYNVVVMQRWGYYGPKDRPPETTGEDWDFDWEQRRGDGNKAKGTKVW